MPNEITIVVQARNATKAVFDAVRKDSAALGKEIGQTVTTETTGAIQREASSGSGAYARAGDRIGETVGDRIRARITEKIRVAVDRIRLGRQDIDIDVDNNSGSGGIPGKTKVDVDVNIDKPTLLQRIGSAFKEIGGRASQFFSQAFGAGLQAAFSGGGDIVALLKVSLLAIFAGPAFVTLGSVAGSAIVTGILGVLGGGAIALGVAGAMKDPQIAAAAKTVKDQLGGIFEDFGGYFRRPVADFLESVSAELIPQLTPMLHDLAEALAPLAGELGQGLIGFLQNVLPPIIRAMRDSYPIIQTLADKLPGLGDDIGVFFEHISRSGPGASIFFEDMLELIGELIKGFGLVIAAFTNMYLGLRTMGFTIVDFFAFVAQEILTAFEAAFGWIPGLSGKFKSAQEKVAKFRKNVQDEINRIPKSRTFTLTIRQVFTQVGQAAVQIGNLLANAHGGIIGNAATGGVRSGLTWVGEHGPELIDAPVGSRVHSNPDSMRMASGGGGGVMVAQLILDGEVLAEAMVEPQRKFVRQTFGGSVQDAYGTN